MGGGGAATASCSINKQMCLHTKLNKRTLLYILAYVPVLRFFSTKAAELKCQNFTVKKVCQVEHFKTFRI